MALKTMIEKVKAARAAYESAVKECGDQLKEGIGSTLAEHIPPGFAVGWEQFTPYFNDGDACTFHVRDAYLFKLTEEDDGHPRRSYSYEDRDQAIRLWTKCAERYDGSVEGLTKDDVEKVAIAWGEMSGNGELMERAFGDHTSVRVEHGGKVVVGECSHD